MPRADLNQVAEKNKENIEATQDGCKISYKQIHKLVLIGRGHDKAYRDLMEEKKDSAFATSGSILVKHGRNGSLTVTHIPGYRSEFDDAIRMFSKKKIIYVDKKK